MWKSLLTLVVAGGIIGGGATLYQYRNVLFRPDFNRVGGTRLACEIDGDAPPGGIDEVVRVLQRRCDQDGAAGILVRAVSEREVEITVPRGEKNKERIDRFKRQLDRPGRLEFRILGRASEDGKAFLAADERLQKPDAKKMSPPPPPKARDGSSRFTSQLPGEPEFTYAWARLSLAETRTLMLDEPSMRRVNPGDLPSVAMAIETGRPFYPATSPDLLVAARQPDPKVDPVFYVLTRQDAESEAIDGSMVEWVRVSRQYSSRSQITLRLNRDGSQRMFAMTSRIASKGWIYAADMRRLGVLIDGEIFSAPALNGPFTAEIPLPADAPTSEAEDAAMLMRGGTLTAKVKLTQEEEVEPR